MVVERGTLLEGTPQETTYYELDSGSGDATGVVLGGVHGNEVNGYRAAEDVVEWELDRGSLVVVPWADVVAIERQTRGGPEGDLNRMFPSDDEPETDLARSLWDLVSGYDPDVVIDLHRSRGIYETHHQWVGQAIFPTAAGDAPSEAVAVIENVNERSVPRTLWFHRFTLGNTLTGDAPMLVHKVGADLNTPGYIVELTDFLLDLDTQVEWTRRITERLLERHGIDRRQTGET